MTKKCCILLAVFLFIRVFGGCCCKTFSVLSFFLSLLFLFVYTFVFVLLCFCVFF